MAKIHYLDKHGLRTLVGEIKKQTTAIYKVKGSAIYADANYVQKASTGTAGYEATITSVGMWQLISNTWTKVTSVKEGWVYNVTNAFVTDTDFIEGADHSIMPGTNVVARNLGTDAIPDMKWDLFAVDVDLVAYQTKLLKAPLTVFTNETPTVYTDETQLPTSEAKATATITDMMIAITSDDKEVYQAVVTTDTTDSTMNSITWLNLGNQTTVEGALKFIGNVAPNTPISDEEIESLFEN